MCVGRPPGGFQHQSLYTAGTLETAASQAYSAPAAAQPAGYSSASYAQQQQQYAAAAAAAAQPKVAPMQASSVYGSRPQQPSPYAPAAPAAPVTSSSSYATTTPAYAAPTMTMPQQQQPYTAASAPRATPPPAYTPTTTGAAAGERESVLDSRGHKSCFQDGNRECSSAHPVYTTVPSICWPGISGTHTCLMNKCMPSVFCPAPDWARLALLLNCL
eukprot:scaffold94434_cov15-Tisochrysis_lutea.AAC.1